MDNIITYIPKSIPEVIIGIAAVIIAFAYVRRNDLKLLRETNADLRLAHKDNQDKITLLEEKMKLMEVEIQTLKRNNKTLEDLVERALIRYFAENPNEAHKIK